MLITEQDTNLAGSQALLGELGDKLVDFLVAGLEPARSTAAVREAGARNTLTIRRKEGEVSMADRGGLGKEEYPGVCIRPILRNFQGRRPGYPSPINQGAYFFDLFLEKK